MSEPDLKPEARAVVVVMAMAVVQAVAAVDPLGPTTAGVDLHSVRPAATVVAEDVAGRLADVSSMHMVAMDVDVAAAAVVASMASVASVLDRVDHGFGSLVAVGAAFAGLVAAIGAGQRGFGEAEHREAGPNGEDDQDSG